MEAFGRPSAAASMDPPLRSRADAATASYRAEGGTTGWCSLTAATLTGVRHRLAGEASQDYFAWAVAGRRLAVAVADGLGSVPGSGDAAMTAAGAAVSAASSSKEGPRQAALAAIDAAESELRGPEHGAGATTLVVCVVDAGGDVALSRVGDSTAFLVDAGEGDEGACWRELFAPPPEHEDEVPVATGALSAEGRLSADVETAAVVLGGSEVVVVVSDGIAGPWRDGPSTVAPAMIDGILGRPSAIELARLADFSRQGCHDDRTIVAVRPRGRWSDADPTEGEG